MNRFGVEGMGKRGYSRQKGGPGGGLRAREKLRVGLLFPKPL